MNPITAVDWLIDFVTEPVLGAVASLSGGGIRAAARNIITEMIPFGYKAGEIVSSLRQFGLGYRYANMLDDIRGMATMVENRDWIAKHDLESVVPKSAMGQLKLPRDANYLVTFRVEVYDETTGQTSEQFKSLYTNDRLSGAEYWDQFSEDFLTGQYPQNQTYTLLGLESVAHNWKFPYT